MEITISIVYHTKMHYNCQNINNIFSKYSWGEENDLTGAWESNRSQESMFNEVFHVLSQTVQRERLRLFRPLPKHTP